MQPDQSLAADRSRLAVDNDNRNRASGRHRLISPLALCHRNSSLTTSKLALPTIFHVGQLASDCAGQTYQLGFNGG